MKTNATSRRSNWGLNGGITIGINLWDGNRRREKRNASLAIRNSQLEREQLELGLKADLSNLWQAYRNNLRLLKSGASKPGSRPRKSRNSQRTLPAR